MTTEPLTEAEMTEDETIITCRRCNGLRVVIVSRKLAVCGECDGMGFKGEIDWSFV